jgi:hypothetical protein
VVREERIRPVGPVGGAEAKTIAQGVDLGGSGPVCGGVAIQLRAAIAAPLAIEAGLAYTTALATALLT